MKVKEIEKGKKGFRMTEGLVKFQSSFASRNAYLLGDLHQSFFFIVFMIPRI